MKFAAATFAALAAAVPALAANITVLVGMSQNGTVGTVFDPQVVTANVGDFVNYEFRAGNHTVTQSSFADPCTQQFNTVTQQNGFTSPFMPFDATTGQIGVFTLEVTQTTTPIWFFCAHTGHCKLGMFGAINPPTTGNKTFAAFAALVPSSNDPAFGTTAPFTPATTNGTTTGGTTGTTGSTSAPATTTTHSGASAVSVRSGLAVALAGVVVSLVL